jgi:hypothetical protein
MSRTVYSALLAQATSLSDAGESVGGPPAGTLWVVRFAAATFGSYLAYVNCALAVQNADPWLWLLSSGSGVYFSDHPITFYWEGRLVVPAGSELWAKASAGDACDLYVSGYQLSVS